MILELTKTETPYDLTTNPTKKPNPPPKKEHIFPSAARALKKTFGVFFHFMFC